MTPERWQMVRGILRSAMELRPEDRAAYLDQQCAGDPSIREEVDEYLSIEGKLDTALAGIKMLMLFVERHLNLTERHVNVTERQLGEPERKH